MSIYTPDRSLKKRITISLDPDIYRRLDNRNRSGDIENILRRHFQHQAIDVIYTSIKRQLEDELALSKRLSTLEDTIAELKAVAGLY